MPTTAERIEIVKTSVTIFEIRDFTKSDWMGFAGCEDTQGSPETFLVEFGNGEKIQFVADDNGICVDHFAKDSDILEVFGLDLPYGANRMVFRGIHAELRAKAENYTTPRHVITYVRYLGFDQV